MIKYISGDGAGELGRSTKFQHMLDPGIKWQSSLITPQSNGIGERAIQQLVRSQLVKAGRGEDY